MLLLALVALAIGWVRSRERLLSERLGQDYVHEIRLLLVREGARREQPAIARPDPGPRQQ